MRIEISDVLRAEIQYLFSSHGELSTRRELQFGEKIEKEMEDTMKNALNNIAIALNDILHQHADGELRTKVAAVAQILKRGQMEPRELLAAATFAK